MTRDDVMSLALCFDAPMQSWGIRSRGIIRDTMPEPTKSGVVGLLAAALGIDRNDDMALAVIAGLRLAVRVDREGVMERDYHVTQNVPTTQGTGHRTVVSERYYLADALFLVVLEGGERILTRVAEAVERPHWRLSFGRKAYVPARPLLAPGEGPVARSAEDVLKEYGWLETSPRTRAWMKGQTERPGLRTVVECPPGVAGTEVRHDQPLSFAEGNRRFAPRAVWTGEVPLTDGMIPAGETLCS
ncbi:type I-E CRISPR-associated protein Cas5/CasD [Streptosporangium saharense]|uniref:CRISPR system Cascade subunit CasD n=1 Tax=Streptosporangium saharense TaxID=1706840 RepID=A0A7W7QSJ3_9ACTN|nr:type I-E CRISPR-associated protein Cas5/CasD [Streptosporangium saharense]MBB4918918.1 CRISPR system Cascade subunit CasD [Streptosporangium saharense]